MCYNGSAFLAKSTVKGNRMDNNPTEKTEQTKIDNQDNGIVVESVEDDMRTYGVDVQESKGEEEAANPEAATDTPKEDEQKPKKKSRAQRKIERQARELKEKEEEIERLRSKSQESNQEEKPGKEDAAEIDIDDFETYEEYKAAVDKAEEVANTKADATETKDKEEKPENGLPKELNTRIADMTEDGQEDYDNFDEVVRNPELPLTQTVLEAITVSEQAADIAYYLGTHLDRAKKLAAMDKRAMDKEILRIEIELEKKPNKVVRTTSAPDPINPVNGGNSSKGKSLDDKDLSYEEHEALLNQGRSYAKGGFL